MTEQANPEYTTAVGVFVDRGGAERAIEDLRNAGFKDEQIGFITQDHSRTTESGAADASTRGINQELVGGTALGGAALGVPTNMGMGANVTPVGGGAMGAPLVIDALGNQTVTDETLDDTRAETARGAVTGGIVGGLLGAAASLLIPGIGPALAGGILAATLGGAVMGAVTGGFIGSFTNLGVSEDDAHYYQSEFQAGRTLVTVKAGGRYLEALSILRAAGAYDAGSRSETANDIYSEGQANR